MSSTRYRTIASALSLGLVACGGGSSSTTTPTSAVPVALQGTWTRKLNGTGEQVKLTLSATGTYQLTRGATQESGMIGVSGFEIYFHSGAPCPGNGGYNWSVGGPLAFVAVASDACAARGEVLTGGLFTRI